MLFLDVTIRPTPVLVLEVCNDVISLTFYSFTEDGEEGNGRI